MSRRDILIGSVGFFGGALIASGVTAAILGKKLQETVEAFDQKIDDEIAAGVKYALENTERVHVTQNFIVTNDDPEAVVPEEEFEKPEEPVKVATLDEVAGERVFAQQPPLEDLAARNQTTRYDKVMTISDGETEDPDDTGVEPEVYQDPNIEVISKEEFFENENGYEQFVFTYFSDGFVMNEQGDAVIHATGKIGEGKPRFGEMSDSDIVVYVRNTKYEQEYEILWDEGVSTDFINGTDDTEVPASIMHSLANRYPPEHQRR